ncbi:MAG: diacylglycerol kinase family protein [Deltaproteobacteria bacterium]|nr:diacylglycerol kinase family protein [Deltaproteobacteria bacterium]
MPEDPTMADERPVRIGVLVNAGRCKDATTGFMRAVEKIVGLSRIACTTSAAQVPEAVRRLVLDEKITVLAVRGGDGTIHHAVNALTAFTPAEGAPVILPLSGGTMNILARGARIKGEGVPILSRFARMYDSHRLRDVPTVDRGLLRVESTTLGARHGFVLGSALTARCLEICDERFGGTPLAFVRLIGAAVSGSLLKTRFWKENGHLATDLRSAAVVDGEAVSCVATVATTVDITLARGLIRGMAASQALARGFTVRTLLDIDPSNLWRTVPDLVFGRPGPGIRDFAAVAELRLAGDFSLDGEIFRVPDRAAETRVTPADKDVRFVFAFP